MVHNDLVPYGLHAHFFTEDEILGQRGVYSLRSLSVSTKGNHDRSRSSWYSDPVASCISWLERLLG